MTRMRGLRQSNDNLKKVKATTIGINDPNEGIETFILLAVLILLYFSHIGINDPNEGIETLIILYSLIFFISIGINDPNEGIETNPKLKTATATANRNK